MKRMRILYITLLVLQFQIHSQDNIVEIHINKSSLTPVNANHIDYNDFTLVVVNDDPKLVKPFSIIEKEGYFNLELKEKRNNTFTYRVRPTEKSRGRKRALKLLLKTEETIENLNIIYFSSGFLDLDRMKKDTILELGFTDHSPNFTSHYVGFTSYSVIREGTKTYIPIPLVRTASIKLNRLWIGDHWLMADKKDTLFKIRVSPPLTLARKEDQQSKVISREFKNIDSLAISIGYAERVDRTQWFAGGEININVCDGQFTFTHETKNPKRQSCNFKGIDKGILDAVLDIETKGKATPQCSSINDDANFIWMTINGQKTSFEFCTNNWDGLKEFIDKIVTMKTN